MLSYIWNQSEFNKNPLCSSSRSFCDVKGWERSRGCPPDSVCCFGPVYSPLSLFPRCKLKPVLNPAQQQVLATERTLSVCASEHVSVCFFFCQGEGYKWEEGGQGRGQDFLFCVVLCPLVLRVGRAQQKGENPNYLSALPSFRSRTSSCSCSLTYLWDLVEWEEMGEESHTDRRTTVWICLSNNEGKKKESGPPECRPLEPSSLSSLPPIWQEVTIHPKVVTKMSSMQFKEKKWLSLQLLDCSASAAGFVLGNVQSSWNKVLSVLFFCSCLVSYSQLYHLQAW